jgi:uncharacterized protein YjbJ (UPF0337 family)
MADKDPHEVKDKVKDKVKGAKDKVDDVVTGDDDAPVEGESTELSAQARNLPFTG